MPWRPTGNDRERDEGLRMSTLIERLPVRSSLATRWQVPVFVLGTLVLTTGIARIAVGRRVTTLEDVLSRVQTLQGADAFTRASAYLVDQLQRRDWSAAERGKLHARLSGVIYDAERRLESHNPQNIVSILFNLEQAQRLGVALDTKELVALGDVHRWSGNATSAADAYRAALSAGASGADRLRRLILELRAHESNDGARIAADELDEILDDDLADPANHLWALERRLEGLLDEGNISAAMGLVARARNRLAGTDVASAVRYLEATCLEAAEMRDEAAEVLRRFRSETEIRDELWARATWLLGRLEQEDHRPQSALLLFEEVLRSFTSGDEYERALLGSAECLVDLGRSDRSIEVCEVIRDRLLDGGNAETTGAAAVRRSVHEMADRVLDAGRLDLGLRFLDVALALTASKYEAPRIELMARRASVLEALVRKAATKSAPSVDPQLIRDYSNRAAKTHLALAELVLPDESAAARHLEAAAEDFDHAEQPDQVIETLLRLVSRYPNSHLRAGALVRLGKARQSIGLMDEAARTYADVIENFPRTPQALQSLVPLAVCLMASGDEGEEQRGVDLLLDIVDDRGADALFSPKAVEYREALLRLIDFYVRTDAARVPDRWERAIRRIAQALALYPDDPETTRFRFLLAEAYRASGAAVAEEAERTASPIAAEQAREESRRRLKRALKEYEQVIALLAAEDSESVESREQSYLQASYLYRGDCLFDLRRYDEAVVAYREASWRYENLPTAVVAMFQMIQCHLRTGAQAEARAAAARLGWLLKKTPAASFEALPGMASKAYWESLVERMVRMGV